MNKAVKLLMFSISIALLSLCYAGDVVLQSQWQDSVIVIDGSPHDWGEHPMAYFKSAGASLGVMNDAHNIYFLLNFKDQPTTRFLQNHITLWFDKTNKNKKFFGIIYHGARPSRESIGVSNQEQWSNMAQGNENHPPMMPEVMMDRIDVINNKDTLTLFGNDNSYHIQVAPQYENGFYCHELRIPLQLIDSLSCATSKMLGEKISVGLELGMNQNEFNGTHQHNGERPDMPNNMPLPGGMSGGSADRGPGMSGGNFSGNPPSSMNKMQMPEKQQYWIKVVLASNLNVNNGNK